MGLTSGTTLTAAVLLTLIAITACLLLWTRVRGPRPVRLACRIGLIVVCQVMAILVTGLAINDRAHLYSSWAEIFGRPSIIAAPSVPVTGALDRTHQAATSAGFRAGHGTVVSMTVPGTASGVPPQRALVYLPAAYGDPAAPDARFPVVELLVGFPGRPENWTGGLELQKTLDAEIANRQSLPMIAVMPVQNVATPRDTQCVDVVDGPRLDTYLTTDVHKAVTATFRAVPDRSGWALMGYSTGGYCALNLAMRHPAMFSAAVSLSGYVRPAHDQQTGELFGRNSALANANTPLWRAQHLPLPDLSVLLVASRPDTLSYGDAKQFIAVAHAPLRVTPALFAIGGHNFGLWRAVEPYAFSWLSHRLVTPLTPVRPPIAR